MDSFVQMLVGFGVLRLGGVDQSQELVHFEALRYVAHQILQLSGRLGELARVILRHCRLEFAL